MRFSTTVLFAAFATLSSAQNPFTFTTLTSVTAGTPFNITWAPSTGTTDTVTILLRQGDPKSLTTVATVASSIQNTGSYIWTPPTTLPAGSDYAFEIVDDGNTDITNYSSQFSISSTGSASSAPSVSPAISSSGASSSSAGTSAASFTTRPSTSTITGQVTLMTASEKSTTTTSTKGGAKTTTTTSGKESGSATRSEASATSSEKSGAGMERVKIGAGSLGIFAAGMMLL